MTGVDEPFQALVSSVLRSRYPPDFVLADGLVFWVGGGDLNLVCPFAV
jgi:hypothetical protein